MAILGQIRKRNGLLIGFVAVALLLFLLGGIDWTRLGGKDPNVLGKVNKEAISAQEYNSQLDFFRLQYQEQFPQSLLEGQVWNTMVQNKLIEQKFNEAGLILTDKMIWEMAKTSPSFANNPRFKDKSGKVSAMLIQQEFEKMEQNQSSSPDLAQQAHLFQTLKKNFGYQAMQKQYLGAYAAGLLTNNKELGIISQNQVDLANIDYVKVDYKTYQKLHPITVTDEDLQAYIEKHKALFKIDDNRTLDYVYFSGKPTLSDEQQTLQSLRKILSGTIIEGDTVQAFNKVKNDSVYVTNLNNAELVDEPFTPQYRYERELPTEIQDWVKTASIGQISEPYKYNDYYIVSKLLGKKVSDSVKAKSIFITYTGANPNLKPKTQRNKEQAKKQADDLAAKINANPADFDKLGQQFSDDQSFEVNKGEIKITTSQISPEDHTIQNYFETAPIGKAGVVEAAGGYLVVTILERKEDGLVYKLADLAKKIQASDATTEKARRDADGFIKQVQGKSSKEFQTLAIKSKFKPLQQTGVLRFGSTLKELGTDKDNDIIDWAFKPNRKLGDTELFTTSDQSYVVVRVSSLFYKGLVQPSVVRKDIEPIVRNEKTGKIIAQEINKSNKTLDQLVAQYKTTKNSIAVSFDSPIIEGSFEPKVGGVAFGIKPGKQSKAIEGKEGVYVLITRTITKGQMPDRKEFKNNIINRYSQQIPSLFMRSLYQEADISDYRGELMDKAKR